VSVCYLHYFYFINILFSFHYDDLFIILCSLSIWLVLLLSKSFLIFICHPCNSIKITGENPNGGYAEYISISEDFVINIPDKLDFEHAAPLFCLGITAYNAVKATESTLAKSVGIFGAGRVGHLAIQFAKLHGSRVIAISRSKNHLDIAKRLGADNVFTYHDYNHIAHTLHNDGNKIIIIIIINNNNNNNNTANHNASSLKIKEKSETSQEYFIANLKNEEGEKLLDSTIVFAPSEEVIGTAIKSVKMVLSL